VSHTTRLTAAERKLYVCCSETYARCTHEPALGTLAERLDIIYRNHGGNTQIVLTKEEKRQRALAEVHDIEQDEAS
jgi:hypothetical protein